MNIYLIGYRAVGKSAVGSLLAPMLERTFIDTDTNLVEQAGMSIVQFVDTSGWGAFRKMERSVLQQICQRDMQVVATGGGVILDHRNTDAMRSTGTLVWLKASLETIRKRILSDPKSDQTRPALSAKGMIKEIEEILTQRTPYYRQAMDLTVETDNLSVEQVCRHLVKQLSESVT
jgi:shikimate kinase